MNMYIFSNACTCFCIFCCCIKIRYGDPDIIGCKLFIIFLKYKAKDQDRLGDPCMPKLQCLLCRSCCKSPDIVIVLDQTGNSSGTMTITVCLDHSDDLCPFFDIFMHFLKIVGNGIQ